MTQEQAAKPHARLFIAILVPDEVKSMIFDAQQQLQRADPQGLIRWTDRYQFHLTLRFLGNVLTDRIPDLTQSAGEACWIFPALHMTATGVGFFPNSRRPRVVWAGIADRENQLPGLQQSLQAATNPFTPEPPQKEFTGHVTLGRFKTFAARGAQDLVTAAERMTGAVFGSWTCAEVHLMQSRLSPTGAIHTSLASFPLRRA